MSEVVKVTLPPQYEEIRFPDGTLVGRIDPHRLVLEVRRKGTLYYFDLALMCFTRKQVSDNMDKIVS